MLRWRIILEDYGLYIEYIKSEKNVVADALSKFTLNGNKENTQKYTYKGKLCQKSMTPKKYLKVIFLLI